MYNIKRKPAIRMMENWFLNFCRGDRIRTCDPLLPKQMRYRTALRPVSFDNGCKSSIIFDAIKLLAAFF